MRLWRAKTASLTFLLVSAAFGSTFVFLSAPAYASVGCGSAIVTSITLSADIGPCVGDGLIVMSSGVTINCAGHSIAGTLYDGTGVNVTGVSGVTVENCNLTGFDVGFYIGPSTKSDSFVDDSANAVGSFGFELDYASSHNKLIGNTEGGAGFSGFLIYYSTHNVLQGNTANSNGQDGILLDASVHNKLTGNTADHNLQFGYYDLGMSNHYSGNECNYNGDGGSSPTGNCTPQS